MCITIRAFLLVASVIAALFPLPALAASKADVEAQFETWVNMDLWPEAQKAGVSDRIFKEAFAGVTLEWDLPDLAPPGFPPPKQQAQSQAEFSSPAPYFNEGRLQKLATTGRGLPCRNTSRDTRAAAPSTIAAVRKPS